MEEYAKVLLDKSTDSLNIFRMIGELLHFSEKDIDELEKNPKIVKFVMDSVWKKSSFPYDLPTMKSRKEADEAVMRALWANYTKGDPVAEEFFVRVRRAGSEYLKELFKSDPECEARCKRSVWFTHVCQVVGISKERFEKMQKNNEMKKMIADCARETALKHGFSEIVNETGIRNPKLNDKKFSDDLCEAVIVHVMKSNEPLETEFFEQFIESFRDRIEWMDDGEMKESQIDSMKKYEDILNTKNPFVIHNGQKMRSSKVDQTKFAVVDDDKGGFKVIDKKDFVTGIMYPATVKKLNDSLELEKYAKRILLDDNDDEFAVYLEAFRVVGNLINLKKEDIDELEKNSDIVEFVIYSVFYESDLFDDSGKSTKETTSDTVTQAIMDNASGGGKAAEELVARMRRSIYEDLKGQFQSDPEAEAQWRMMLWFQKVCHVVGISNERYAKMTKNLEMMEMISDLARLLQGQTASKHGFSEIVNNEGNREPKLKEDKFQEELCLYVLQTVANSFDPLKTEFFDHFVESKKERIASMEDCKTRRAEIISLESFEEFLERKDPTVVYNGQKMRSSKVDQMNVGEEAGDIDQDFEDRNKDLKSLEEGCEEESDGEEEEGGVLSFLSSMLEHLRI